MRNDDSIAANALQNNVAVPLRAEERGQLDLSAGYALPFMNEGNSGDAWMREPHQRAAAHAVRLQQLAVLGVLPGLQVLL